jgi:flavin-dependent dehydrogenase
VTAQRFDVIVVGARCAGSPLATLLARRGLSVALVERATFPRDTLSTHIFESDGLAFLDRLGLIDRLRATGAPIVQRIDSRTDDVRLRLNWPQRPDDPGGLMSIRRLTLDPILAEAAADAGAEVRMGTTVTRLVQEAGRVVGVRVDGDACEGELRARLVVGADGRNSTVARLCGARRYNLTPNERALYWTYFEGADAGSEPTFAFHRWADRFVLGIPTDSGLYSVQVGPELAELDGFRRNLEPSFMEHALSCEPVASAVGGARRVGRFFGMVRWTGFFREASGPGWVLAGDAGHFKDPAGGRGIGDAFHQVDALAPAIAAGLDGSDEELDRSLNRWSRWRDDDFAEHYWFATDLGKAGPLPTVLPEVVRGLDSQGKASLMLDVQNHRVKPSNVLTPPRLLGATARALVRRGSDRRTILRDVGARLREEIRRRRLNRRPDYSAPAEAAADAGPTEVDQDAVTVSGAP